MEQQTHNYTLAPANYQPHTGHEQANNIEAPPVYCQPPPMVIHQMPASSMDVQRLPTTCIGRYPTSFYCTKCKREETSRIRNEIGYGGWFVCICCFGSIIGCLPLCVTSMQDAIHTCPRCNSEVGKEAWLC